MNNSIQIFITGGTFDKSYNYKDGNLYFDGLVTTFAQVEGLEAKLNAKDKLIEKLSARLDELELKFKALK